MSQAEQIKQKREEEEKAGAKEGEKEEEMEVKDEESSNSTQAAATSEKVVSRETVAADLKVQETIEGAKLVQPKKGRFMQLYTESNAAFFVNVETGATSFFIPEEYSFSSLIFMTHINEGGEASGMRYYYEDMETKEVTWEAPIAYLSNSEMGK